VDGVDLGGVPVVGLGAQDLETPDRGADLVAVGGAAVGHRGAESLALRLAISPFWSSGPVWPGPNCPR